MTPSSPPVKEWPTAVTFCAIKPPEDFPLYFYGRFPTAPDLQIKAEELDLDRHPERGHLLVHGDRPVPGTQPQAHIAAHEARPRTGLKPRGSSPSWTSTTGRCSGPRKKKPGQQVAKILPHVTVAIGNDKECAVAVGEGTPDEQADRLLAAGVEIAVVKLGPEGVMAKTRTERVVSAPVPVETVNGLGAGDSFGGAFCHGLLSGWPLAQVLDFANAAGALVASRLSCADAMPTPEEVTSLLAERGRLLPGASAGHRRSSTVSLNVQPSVRPSPSVDDDPRRYEHLSTIRLEDPAAIARAAKARRRHPGVKAGKQNFIVAADHPARGALAVGSDPVAMADRRQLLDRLQIALGQPGRGRHPGVPGHHGRPAPARGPGGQARLRLDEPRRARRPGQRVR
jgi:5-dehydro-2-deoxygluconokinase